MIRRPQRNQKNRRAMTRGVQARGADAVGSFDFTTPAIEITFTQPVTLKGIPQVLTNTSKLPTAAVQNSATVVTLTYDTPGSVTTVTVPQADPAIRTRSGGYLAAGTFPAP